MDEVAGREGCWERPPLLTYVARRQGDVDVEGLQLGEAGGLEEDDGIAEDGIAAEDLGRPDDAVLCCVEKG